LLIGSKIDTRPPGRSTRWNSRNAASLCWASMSTERVVTTSTDASGMGDRCSAAALTNSARSATPSPLAAFSAVIEEVLRDVAEDDAARLLDERHRTKGDQPVAAPTSRTTSPGRTRAFSNTRSWIGPRNSSALRFCSASSAWRRASTHSAHLSLEAGSLSTPLFRNYITHGPYWREDTMVDGAMSLLRRASSHPHLRSTPL
jgi:hypothetical protein